MCMGCKKKSISQDKILLHWSNPDCVGVTRNNKLSNDFYDGRTISCNKVRNLLNLPISFLADRRCIDRKVVMRFCLKGTALQVHFH